MSNPDHIRRDSFFLLKAAVTCVQSTECSDDDIEAALYNIDKARSKLEELRRERDRAAEMGGM